MCTFIDRYTCNYRNNSRAFSEDQSCKELLAHHCVVTGVKKVLLYTCIN